MDEKTPAYTIGRSKLKSFILAILALFFFLSALGVVYFRLFLDAKARNQLLSELKHQRAAQVCMTVILQDSLQHLKYELRVSLYALELLYKPH